MKVLNTTPGAIHEAAKRARGIDIADLRPANKRQTAWNFVLRPRNNIWRRVSASYFNAGRRKVNAVCWHGHREFFRALFDLSPNAKIRTTLAKYNSREHFEDTYTNSDRNIGAPIAPVAASEACICGEGAF